ncbi:hypothetical protein BDW22DRAFT_432189 [Trametopsis cervina]|nr:hypothetical protein BDW22DRAFT_432189 [Trametopsis cervina]
MSQCQTIPTATLFGTVTSDSLETSSSASTTTIPASVTTITTSSCAVVSGVTGSCVPTDVVSTISPEQVVTTQVPIVITVPVTATNPTATLFSTSCSDITSPPVSSDSGSSASSSSVSTLPPTTSLSVIQSSSTLPGGSIIIVYSTSTTVVTPTTLVPVSSGHSGSSTNLGAIIGGVVGGVAFIAAIVLLVFFCIRRRHKNRDDDFDHVDGKIYPFPIRLHKNHNKPAATTMTLDDPATFDPYNGDTAVSNTPTEGFLGAPTLLPPPTSSIRRRTTGGTNDMLSSRYSAVPGSSAEYSRSGSPPVPPSDASVFSESVYSQDSRRPPGPGNPLLATYPPTRENSRRPVRSPMPPVDESVLSDQGSLDDGIGGSSDAPYVHSDAGRIPVPVAGASTQPPPRRTKAQEARLEAPREGADAPPAYEA